MHAHRAGVLGVVAYVLTVLNLVYANAETFLTLAALSSIPKAHEASLGLWNTLPLSRVAVYGLNLGLVLLGLAVARAGVLTRWAGLLVAFGVALLVSFEFTIQAYFLGIFWIIGALLISLGLLGMGRVLWSRPLLAAPAPS